MRLALGLERLLRFQWLNSTAALPIHVKHPTISTACETNELTGRQALTSAVPLPLLINVIIVDVAQDIIAICFVGLLRSLTGRNHWALASGVGKECR